MPSAALSWLLVRTKAGLWKCSRTLPAIIPARDSWHSGRNTTRTLSFAYRSSTCRIASASPFAVISLRRSFNSFSSSASRSASSLVSACKSRRATSFTSALCPWRYSLPSRTVCVCSLNGRNRSFSSPQSKNAPIEDRDTTFRTASPPNVNFGILVVAIRRSSESLYTKTSMASPVFISSGTCFFGRRMRPSSFPGSSFK